MSTQPNPAEVPLFVAVTGHRDLVAEEVPGITERVREFLQGLGREFPDTPVKILSPLADGGDRVVAREARALGLELVVPLPLPKALYQQDFTDTESRQEFEVLCAAGTVYELPLAAGNTLASVSSSSTARATHTARPPLPTSSRRVRIAGPLPAVRKTFVAPALPLPTVRTSTSFSHRTIQ